MFEIILIVTVLVAPFLNTILTKYLGEKGKNLATKQDIEVITKKVEEVKMLFDKKAYFSKKQFDYEYETYRELWKKVYDWRCYWYRSVNELAPEVDSEILRKKKREVEEEFCALPLSWTFFD